MAMIKKTLACKNFLMLFYMKKKRQIKIKKLRAVVIKRTSLKIYVFIFKKQIMNN